MEQIKKSEISERFQQFGDAPEEEIDTEKVDIDKQQADKENGDFFAFGVVVVSYERHRHEKQDADGGRVDERRNAREDPGGENPVVDDFFLRLYFGIEEDDDGQEENGDVGRS